MFLHSFKYNFKIIIRNRVLIFWSLVFPIVLGLLYNLALGNIYEKNSFKEIPVSVNQTLMDDEMYKSFVDGVSEDGVLKLIPTDDLTLLKNDEVKAHIESKDEIIIKGSGIEQSIVEKISNLYLVTENTMVRVYKDGLNPDINQVVQINDYIDNKTPQNMDGMNVYFYALLGMQAFYGYSFGLQAIFLYEANLSTKAKRNAISPVNKNISLFGALAAAWLINMIIIVFSIFVFKYAYKVDFGDKLPYSILFMIFASLTGVVYGVILGASNKKDRETKTGIGVATTMLMSFLAGMMVPSVKMLIQRHIPILNKLNPITLITDGLYSLYYYNTLDRFYNNFIWLACITLVFIVISVLLTRGKKYDSI